MASVEDLSLFKKTWHLLLAMAFLILLKIALYYFFDYGRTSIVPVQIADNAATIILAIYAVIFAVIAAIAAIVALTKNEWSDIEQELEKRHDILFKVTRRIAAKGFFVTDKLEPLPLIVVPSTAGNREARVRCNGQPSLPETKIDLSEAFQLATVDVFVEKAQHRLTFRANWLVIGGVSAAAIASCILLYAAWLLHTESITPILNSLKDKNSMVLTVHLVRATTVTALLGAVVYIFSQLSKAFLHEAAVLFSRRHALRFGRLYVYLNRGDVNLKDLQEAFQWNNDFQTAFTDMKTGASDIIKKIVEKTIEENEKARNSREEKKENRKK